MSIELVINTNSAYLLCACNIDVQIRRPGKKHRARADPHAFGATDATASYAASGAASNHSTVPIMPHDSLADPSPSPSFISAPAACPGTSAENGISGSPSSGEEARREHSPTALDRRTEGVDLNIALEPMMTPQQYAVRRSRVMEL